MAIKLDSKQCVGCGQCQEICDNDAIQIKNYVASIDYDKCTHCGNCLNDADCPGEAISEED